MKKDLPEEIFRDKDVNAFLLKEMLSKPENEKNFEKDVDNQYLQLLKFMKEKKRIENDPESKMTMEMY